ncbi:MAG TPA: phosphoribosylanthranilate isomerase [Candidatus Cybelea sp.]|jgi:phosphoribosylanthranilate isomerase|nr:phosphoribosylanthranilate isomerase [Candidatus Cybelea sp.]
MAEAWIKFCGCTSLADVTLAAQAGADAFGMIFAPSPRRIGFEEADAIARRLPAGISPVAVFVNPERADVDAVLERFPAALLQFSGEETPDFVARYGDRAIKAIHVDDHASLLDERCARYPEAILLFDARQDGMAGGTGTTFDWNQAAHIAAQRRVVIAGGLRPGNVAECVQSAHPFGVDVRTGIETDGRKDEGKMRDFVRAVRQAR